jgi:hypothetical protein
MQLTGIGDDNQPVVAVGVSVDIFGGKIEPPGHTAMNEQYRSVGRQNQPFSVTTGCFETGTNEAASKGVCHGVAQYLRVKNAKIKDLGPG